jgi:hypothetical protein
VNCTAEHKLECESETAANGDTDDAADADGVCNETSVTNGNDDVDDDK